jgi:hypothetical protein
MDSYGGDIPILVIDYSGSFTEDELRKNKLEETSEIHIFNAKESIIKIQCGPTMEYVVDNVVEALVTLDHDMPVTQQDILQKCTYEAFRLNGYITFIRTNDLEGYLITGGNLAQGENSAIQNSRSAIGKLSICRYVYITISVAVLIDLIGIISSGCICINRPQRKIGNRCIHLNLAGGGRNV